MGIFEKTLIVSDLDGTLTGSDGQISEQNREAIKYYCGEGGSFSISTSRPLQTFGNLIGPAPFNVPIIHANGSFIYDHAAKRAVFSDYLDDMAMEICRETRRSFPETCLEIFTDDKSFVVNPSQLTIGYHQKTGAVDIVVAEPEEAAGRWIKLAITCDEREALLDLRERLEGKFPSVKFIFSSPRYLEVLQHGANKGFGALKLAEHLGIDKKDLYTAGNYDNDLDLLGVAAVSFAPSSSSKAVLDMADVILPDSDSSPFVALISHLEGIYKKTGGSR